MTYKNKYNRLSGIYTQERDLIKIPESDIYIHNVKFKSDSSNFLPCIEEIYSKQSYINNNKAKDEDLFQNYPDTLKCDDFNITENKEFKYIIFKKSSKKKAHGVIFLLHGLNERTWDKYLPWAQKLVELTDKAVVLFPIAFHINRSPEEWSHPRLMRNVSETRRCHYQSVENSHFCNAALSIRIQMFPQRLFWSGLQTFQDILKLIEEIRKGKHPLIHGDAQIDFFAYSLGSFLSEILFMANPNDYFKNSKLFIFCGGSTLDRMRLNSKYILDSDAFKAIHSFYIEHLESELILDQRVAHFLNGDNPIGIYFKAMLDSQKDIGIREKRLQEINDNITAVALKKDEVIPSEEVLNTLKGENRNIPIHVEVVDFSFPYDHVHPFPIRQKIDSLVDDAFNQIFEIASHYLQ